MLQAGVTEHGVYRWRVKEDVSYRNAPVPEDKHTQKLLYGSY